jgi:hypothetical protein
VHIYRKVKTLHTDTHTRRNTPSYLSITKKDEGVRKKDNSNNNKKKREETRIIIADGDALQPFLLLKTGETNMERERERRERKRQK